MADDKKTESLSEMLSEMSLEIVTDTTPNGNEFRLLYEDRIAPVDTRPGPMFVPDGTPPRHLDLDIGYLASKMDIRLDHWRMQRRTQSSEKRPYHSYLDADQGSYAIVGRYFSAGVLTFPERLNLSERRTFESSQLFKAISLFNSHWGLNWNHADGKNNSYVVGALDLESGEQWEFKSGRFHRCENGDKVVSMPPSWKPRMKKRRRRRGRKWLR